jgi:long-subunit acyl-CoA synthetase (AMP-forming)
MLKNFQVVIFSGAPLRPDVGFFFSRSGVRLLSAHGM